MDKSLEFWFAIVFAIAKDYVWWGHMTHQLKAGRVVRERQLKVGGGCVLPATLECSGYLHFNGLFQALNYIVD